MVKMFLCLRVAVNRKTLFIWPNATYVSTTIMLVEQCNLWTNVWMVTVKGLLTLWTKVWTMWTHLIQKIRIALAFICSVSMVSLMTLTPIIRFMCWNMSVLCEWKSPNICGYINWTLFTRMALTEIILLAFLSLTYIQ